MDGNQKRAEDLKLRRLRLMVDMTLSLLIQVPMTRGKAEEMVESLRFSVLRMFPGKEKTWEIIYAPRFQRIIGERWGKKLDG